MAHKLSFTDYLKEIASAPTQPVGAMTQPATTQQTPQPVTAPGQQQPTTPQNTQQQIQQLTQTIQQKETELKSLQMQVQSLPKEIQQMRQQLQQLQQVKTM